MVQGKPRRSALVCGAVVLLGGPSALVLALTLGPGGEKLPPVDTSDPIARMNEGVGWLEEYRYLEAHHIFDALAKAFPEWEAAHVNRGIAALNLQNEYLKVAEGAFRRALELNPRSAHALISLGILYHHTQKTDAALDVFRRAAEVDPDDPHALYYLGVIEEEKGRLDESLELLEKAVKLQPSFSSAHYRLRQVYVKKKDLKKMDAVLKEFKRLEDAREGIKAGLKYGEAGKYSMAIRHSAPPGWKGKSPEWQPSDVPAFGAPLVVSTAAAASRSRPDGKRWAPAFALGDLDGDGALEIVSSGESGAGGGPPVTAVHTRSEGAYRSLDAIPADSAACAVGDIDGDNSPDVVIAGDGWLKVLVNDGRGKLSEKAFPMEGANPTGFPVRLCVVDADSDWDLDVLCLRQEKAGERVRSRLEVLNNNRDGTFRDISGASGIGPFDFPAVDLLVADFDGDIDSDILVIDGRPGREARAKVYANERVWRYRPGDLPLGVDGDGPVESASAGDFDGDGDLDIVLFRGSSLGLLENSGGLRFRDDAAFRGRFGPVGGTAGILADVQGAMRAGLLVLDGQAPPAEGAGGAARAPGAGGAGGAAARGPVFIAHPEADAAVPVSLDPGPAPHPAAACLAVLRPEGPAELIVRGAEKGAAAYPLRASASWIGLDLEGPKKPSPDKERANAGGVGATVEVRAGSRRLVTQLAGSGGGAARPPPRVHCGLGGASGADYVRILWPDGVLQAERGLGGRRTHRIREIDRKPSSCPILYAWTGDRFEFLGDFLGVGGLGYLELPGVYSRPDPSEYILLPHLEPRGGEYLLEVLEPLEECTYLDELKLTVVDHPAGVTVLPEEMFAVKGPAPGFRLLAFRDAAFPLHASNEAGRDVTAEARSVDRIYANEVDRDPRFPGLARGLHRLDLDFGDGLDRLPARPGSRSFLFLHGFIEYGYSTSNFAAWQAKASFRAPTIRVERGGEWIPLREEWGFPAGYPRYMAVDLTDLLEAGDRRLRIDTNMEIHWDQAFAAECTPIEAGADPEITVTDLAAEAAVLAYRGYPPEESPDGRKPLLYAHEGFEPEASFKVFPGRYTRYGDVRRLLDAADDRFVIFGPGDGLRVSFRADRLPPPGEGRKRTFLARTFGYCKDMDLYTAHPERVEPLPFRAMSGYPYGPGESYPATPANEAYRREWNTRTIER